MNSALASTKNQPHPGALARQAAWCCAAITLALLLLQPLFCTITCLLHGHSSHAAGQHQHHAQASSPLADSALASCLPLGSEVVHAIFVPAFWPGLLPTLAILLMLCGMLHRLSPRIQMQPGSHCWAPPLPPPRPLGI